RICHTDYFSPVSNLMGIDAICGPAVWHPGVSAAIRSTVLESAERAAPAAGSAVSSNRSTAAAAVADPSAAAVRTGATTTATRTVAASIPSAADSVLSSADPVPAATAALRIRPRLRAGQSAFFRTRGELRDVG